MALENRIAVIVAVLERCLAVPVVDMATVVMTKNAVGVMEVAKKTAVGVVVTAGNGVVTVKGPARSNVLIYIAR